ncbi:MAG: putative PEP-binding protein [Pseudomonadota bacterium]
MSDEVVGFGHGGSRAARLDIDSYGSKAARLAAMAHCGLSVPPSIALPISACRKALTEDGDVSVSFQVDISRGVRGLQRTTHQWLGDKDDPLILAVRLSPARPQGGLGVPVITVGWTEEAIELLEDKDQKEAACRDLAHTLRELSSHIFNVDGFLFDEKLEEAEEQGPVVWRELYPIYREIALTQTEGKIPLLPSEQLILAVKAVWQSWYKPRAQTYRQLYEIGDAGGIGVLIQVSVPWEEADEVSSGWIAVRCEKSGERKVHGEYFLNGEAPAKDLSKMTRKAIVKDLIAQAETWETRSARAERLDFIISDKKAFVIDGTPLSLTTAAEVTFAVEMVEAGAISKEEAVRRINPAKLIDILHASLDRGQEKRLLSTGLAASPGAATGRIVFSASSAEALKSKGWDVILVCSETSPEDIRGMQSSSAIVTSKGGLTSHAAVIARGTGKPCIVSVSGVKFDAEGKKVMIEGRSFAEGDHLTVDGSEGALYEGKLALSPSEMSGALSTLLSWADDFRRMKVLTNVESPNDAALAIRFGAEGIGLCRTEHMMFEPQRLSAMRRIIMANDQSIRDAEVERLVPLLREDFINLFEVMLDRPVTIRLFDPPLHEFLPKEHADIANLASNLGIDATDLAFNIDELSETNPMLGNRGCRLLICNPELAKTLVQVVFEATIEVSRRHEIDIKPEIMVPLVAMSREFIAISRLIDDAAQTVEHELDFTLHYKVGSMIELPRAAVIAERIAAEADFFSFGTNDLTQTTFGISRDDAVAFLTTYEKLGLMEHDPFVTIDEDGVGAVIELATERGREANPNLEVGICGEHGGDPDSIHFCENLQLDYVSCSPFRIPIARLAAAQATLDYRDRNRN